MSPRVYTVCNQHIRRLGEKFLTCVRFVKSPPFISEHPAKVNCAVDLAWCHIQIWTIYNLYGDTQTNTGLKTTAGRQPVASLRVCVCVLYPLSLGATTLPFPSCRLWLRWCHGSRQWKGRLFNVGLLFLALRPYALHIEPWLDPAHRRPPVVLVTTRSAMSADSWWPQRGSVGSASANLQWWCQVTVYLHIEILARVKGFVYNLTLERFFIFIF